MSASAVDSRQRNDWSQRRSDNGSDSSSGDATTTAHRRASDGSWGAWSSWQTWPQPWNGGWWNDRWGNDHGGWHRGHWGGGDPSWWNPSSATVPSPPSTSFGATSTAERTPAEHSALSGSKGPSEKLLIPTFSGDCENGSELGRASCCRSRGRGHHRRPACPCDMQRGPPTITSMADERVRRALAGRTRHRESPGMRRARVLLPEDQGQQAWNVARARNCDRLRGSQCLGHQTRTWRPLPLPSWVTEARKVSRQPPHVMCSHKVTAHMLGAGCGDSTHQTREPISRRDRRGQCRLDGMLRAERGGCHTLCLSVHWGREVFCLSSLAVGWEGGAVPHLVVSGPSLGWRSRSGLFRRPVPWQAHPLVPGSA